MTTAGPPTITVELNSGAPPISGRLLVGPHLVRPFTGWIGLLAALDEAIGDERPGAEGAERNSSPPAARVS